MISHYQEIFIKIDESFHLVCSNSFNLILKSLLVYITEELDLKFLVNSIVQVNITQLTDITLL